MTSGEQIAPGGGLDADTRASGVAAAGAPVPAADGEPNVRIGATDETLAASEGARSSGAPPDDAPTLSIGSRLDRYVVLGRLGAGGMGEVYSGYDEELDRRVALKITRSSVLGESERRGRMRREAQALARLSHPNVVQIHDVGELDGQLFIAMEHVKGETLRDWQVRVDPRVPAQRQMILDMYAQAGRGLAAAHEVGIVHRDFKPSNVLVGIDGRARVLDFGLADRSEAAPEIGRVATGEGEDRDSHLTATGSILGTPAYMAPEQFRGGKSDERTDIFAFSVALHEALHGESPFGGDTIESRRAAVVEGRLRDPPSTAIPEWLRAVLARGLALDPADRYPRMDMMLAALADDPVARRSRRLRWLGLGVATLAVGAALLMAALWGLESLQRGQAEAQASERLVAVERRIAELVEAGAVDEAERAFFAFAEHPDNRGRAALGRAWLGRAERAGAREDAMGATDAFATAYTVASRPADQTSAIVGLARLFRGEMQWGGLVRALAALDARADDASEPRGSDDLRDIDELRLDTALARRDLAGAAALLRGPLAGSPRTSAVAVIEALRPATMTEHHHRGFARLADIDGDGRPELALETSSGERRRVPLLRATPQLPTIAAVDLGKDTIRVLAGGPGRPALFVVNEGRAVDGEPADAVVSRWDGTALIEVTRWREGQVLSALAADIDGDGAPEYLVGSGPYTRRVVELVEGPDDAWSTRPSAPVIGRRRSDIVDLLAHDLDGDGGVEVLAVLGPWNAYELQVLRHDRSSDSLATVTRRRLGNMSGAAVVQGGADGPEIVVSKTDEYPNSLVFSRARPCGEPAGTYLFRVVNDALRQTAFAPAPALAGGARVLDDRPLVGDLDGDGRDEVIVGREVADALSSAAHDVTVILVRGAGDSLTPLLLADTKPVAALDLDGDGDDELIVSLGDQEHRVWVLGSGPAAVPRRAYDAPERVVRTAPRDPVLARMWRHADDLREMGLARQSADSLVMIADLVGEPELRARAEQAAAELHEALEDDVQAAALFARAAREPALARRAHEGAARSSLRLARLEAASEHVEALTDGQGEAPSELRAAVAGLRGGPVVDHDFTRRLAPGWSIHQPLALRWDGARGMLHLDAPVPGEVLSAPVHWAGESMMLEVDLELTQLEWRAGLEIGLAREGAGVHDAASLLSFDITTTGGDNERVHQIGCVVHGSRTVARLPFTLGDPGQRLGRFKIRAMVLPGLGEWVCAVERGDGEGLLYSRGRLTAARAEGPLRLTIAARGGWAEADLRRLRLTGVRPEAEAMGPLDVAQEARQRMVAGDERGVLDALATAPAADEAEPLLRVVALTRLGRWRAAERALAVIASDPDAFARQQAALQGLLYTDPAIYGPLLAGAAGSAVLRVELAETWSTAVIMDNEPRGFEAVWAGFAERDLEADAYDTLKVHAVAAAALGHRTAAEASYRAALRALDDPARSGVEGIAGKSAGQRWVHLELAALALAAGDEAAARRELVPLLESADSALITADRLHAREDLRALWSLAPM